MPLKLLYTERKGTVNQKHRPCLTQHFISCEVKDIDRNRRKEYVVFLAAKLLLTAHYSVCFALENLGFKSVLYPHDQPPAKSLSV